MVPQLPPEENPSTPVFPEPALQEQLFGAHSRLDTTINTAPIPAKQSDPQQLNLFVLDGLVVLLFLLYLRQLYRHIGSIGLLFRSLGIKGQFDQLIGEQSVLFRTFLRSARLMGMLAVLVLLLKGVLIWLNNDTALPLPELVPQLLVPILAASMLAVLLYKRIVTGIIAMLSGKKERVEKIRTFNQILFTTTTFFLTPIALFCGLSDPEQQRPLFIISVIILTTLLLYYIWKSFSFFVSRKISVLQWILYLCAVEIWPISFFVLFALRGFEW